MVVCVFVLLFVCMLDWMYGRLRVCLVVSLLVCVFVCLFVCGVVVVMRCLYVWFVVLLCC